MNNIIKNNYLWYRFFVFFDALFIPLIMLATIITLFLSITLIPNVNGDLTTQDFLYVGKLESQGQFVGSAVAIKNHTVISCAHLIGANKYRFILNNNVYDIKSFKYKEGIDLVLIETEQEIKDFIEIEKEKLILDDAFYGIGYGAGGKIKDYKLYPNLDYGVKQLFKNRMSELTQTSISFDLSDECTLETTNGAVPGEGMICFGDSGGAMVLERNLRLVGIFNSFQEARDSDGRYTTKGNAVNLMNPEVLEWINQNAK